MSGFVTKDSGERARFESGMQRDTEAGKARFDLLHPVGVPYQHQFLTRVAELMGRGAEKYEDRNWEKANSEAELARMKSSAYRHFMQWLTGEADEDHAAAVVFNLLAHESIRFKIADSNALESEDPLVDEGFVGTDRPLLDRLVYWSKRLRDAWDSNEHAHKGDEIEYAQENLDEMMDLARERDLDWIEGPRPLLEGDGWQSVGYVDETQNWPDSNSFAVLKNPDYELPFREPTPFLDQLPVGSAEWKSPALIGRSEALEELLYGGEAHADGSDCYGQCARPDFPRVKLDDQWYQVSEIPEFEGRFGRSDLKPLMDKIREDTRRRVAQAMLTYAWPRVIMAGLSPHRTFAVDSDGEIEIEDLLQDAFNRRGIITT